jgi:hypothetical protein
LGHFVLYWSILVHFGQFPTVLGFLRMVHNILSHFDLAWTIS